MTEHILTQEVLKELLHYNPDTGIFTWKRRDRKWFKTVCTWKTFKKRFEGREAGAVCAQGYIVIRILSLEYKAHRLAFLYMEGNFPEIDADHINGVRSDNTWTNIRRATRQENCRNMKRMKSNKTGIMGVFRYKNWDKYETYIRVKGKLIKLGWYDDFFEACCARKSGELKYGFHANHGRR